jgi:dihydrofolate reductase
MRKIVLYMFTTLDGFIAGPNGEFDDYEPSVEESKFANAFFSSADGILFGRITYEGFVSYWDSLDLTDESISTTDIEFAKIFSKLTRVVISRTLDTVGANTILIKDNVAAEVLRVKQQPGGYLVLICGPELLSTLVESGLVDEYRLLVKPRVLGRGKGLFESITRKLRLTLLSTKVFESGVVMNHYQPAEELCL